MSALMEQRALVEKHWLHLVEASEGADVPEHLFLGVLAALVADLLARQPPRVASQWLADLPSRVEQLRARRAESSR